MVPVETRNKANWILTCKSNRQKAVIFFSLVNARAQGVLDRIAFGFSSGLGECIDGVLVDDNNEQKINSNYGQGTSEKGGRM